MKLNDRMELMRLTRALEEAPKDKRPAIQRRIDALMASGPKPRPASESKGSNDPKGTSDAKGAGAKKASDPKGAPAPQNTNQPAPEPESSARLFSDAPHAPYCLSAELVPMIEVDGGFMTYGAFREKHTETIFDLLPDQVRIMYLDQNRVEKLYSNAPEGTEVRMKDLLSHCARQLPQAYEPVELAIINGLLYAEALYDPRIAGNGYEGKTMDDFANAGLFNDFYDCVLYNMFHEGMERDEAREYANKMYAEEAKRAKAVKEVENPTKSSSEKKSSEKPQQSSEQKTPKPNPAPKKATPPKKGSSSRSNSFASMI